MKRNLVQRLEDSIHADLASAKRHYGEILHNCAIIINDPATSARAARRAVADKHKAQDYLESIGMTTQEIAAL